MSKFNANSVEVEEYIHEMAKKSRLKAFYPQTISRKLNIPIDIVLIELLKLSEVGKIDLKYEIKCLEDLNTIKTVDNYSDLIGKSIFCDTCGKEIEITYNNVYPIYYLNEEYKEYVKKKV